MIIGENRVVERGGMLTACGTPDPSRDPNEQACPVVNRPISPSRESPEEQQLQKGMMRAAIAELE
jgi:hypothetical protein